MSLRENLPRDAVAELRTHEPITIGSDAAVGDAVELMKKNNSGCLFVTQHGCAMGVFTERDVLTKVIAGDLPLTTPIVDVMTPNPRVVHEGDSVADVIREMHGGGFRHMPVVDGDGCLKSVISVKRVVRYLVEHFPSAVFTLPPESGQEPLTREGA